MDLSEEILPGREILYAPLGQDKQVHQWSDIQWKSAVIRSCQFQNESSKTTPNQFLVELPNNETRTMNINMDQAYCSQESLNAVMVEDYLALYNDSPVIVFYPLVDRFHFDQDDNQVIVQPLANSYAHVVPYQRPYCGSNGELNCLVDIQRAITHWFLEKKSKYLILQRDRALLGCKVLFYLSEIRQWREGVIQDFSGNHCSIFDRMTLQSKLLDPRITDIRPMISDEILAELSDESTCFRHGRLNRLFSLSNIKLHQCINGSNFNPIMVTQSESRQIGIFPNSNYDDMHSNNNHLELEIPTSKAMATPTITLSSSPTNNLLNSVSCNDQDHPFLLTKENQLDPITPSNWNDALRLLQPRRKRRRKFDCETKSSKNTDAVDINPIQSEKIVQMTNLPPENKNSSEDSKMAASKDSNDNLSPANVEKSDNDPVHAEDLPIPNVNTKATLHAHTYNSQESQKNLPDEARRNSSGDCKTAALEDINENFPPPDVEKSGNDPAKAEDLSAVNVNTKATLSDYAYNAQESPIDLPHETREIDKFQFELNCLEYQSKKKKKKIMNLKSDNFRNQDLTSIRSSSSSKQLTSLPIGPQALPVTKHQAKAAPKSLTETLAMRTTLPVTDSWSKPEADSLPKSCLNVSKAIQAESWAEVSTSALSPIPPNHSGKQDFNNGVKSTDSVKKRKTMPKSLPKDGSLTPQPCSCNQLVKYLPRCLDCGSFQDDNSDIEDNCCRFLNFRLLSFAGKWNAREFCLDKNSTISNIWLPGKNGKREKCEKLISRYILQCTGEIFLTILADELQAIKQGDKDSIYIKPSVDGFRELCDVCRTSIFNVHWTCKYCGFTVCKECVQEDFIQNSSMDKNKSSCISWLKCGKSRKLHTMERLILTEIIPLKAMSKLQSTLSKRIKRIKYTSISTLNPELKDPPFKYICDDKLVLLNEPDHPNNIHFFLKRWIKNEPVVVCGIHHKTNSKFWNPQYFIKNFAQSTCEVINCRTGAVMKNFPKDKFWLGFDNYKERTKFRNESTEILKLKDWPPAADFREVFPDGYDDIMSAFPFPELTSRDGSLNLAAQLGINLPPNCVKPDLGPKMYNAYGSAAYPNSGTTNLHIDISDAINTMVYVSWAYSKDGKRFTLNDLDYEDCDESQIKRVTKNGEMPGAIWHIYSPDYVDKIRLFLREHCDKKQTIHSDPIHDQSFYITPSLRKILHERYKVKGWAILQCQGDAIIIPAGAPHQVKNLNNCIKIAEDFISPEHINQCLKLTEEFRKLSDFHSNHEDKLQIKNILYHTVKNALST